MITLRPRGKRIQCDIRFKWPDGTEYRERISAPVTGKAAALRWAQAREAHLLGQGKAATEAPAPVAPKAPVLTLAKFWPTVLRDHYQANRKKASTISGAESIWKTHLEPALGQRPLAAIDAADVAALKGRLAKAKPKTVNNVLSVLSRILKCAVRWGKIPAMPVGGFDLLKIPPGDRNWYEVHEYRRLIDGAHKAGKDNLAVVLLAGSCGLRLGEIRALRWCDVDLTRRQITISRNLWHDEEGAPKGGRGRVVPMTPEVHAVLSDRKAKVPPIDASMRVVKASIQTVRTLFSQAQRRAGLPVVGGVHMLRHTFCSHLAIAGVPAKAIQELAGHADLATTMRYLHLAPTHRNEAMDALVRLYEPVREKSRAVFGED